LVNCVVELVLKIAARTKGIPAMVEALATVMGQARLQRGCVDCRLYAETGNPQSLCYLEQWSTLRDLESQLRSPRFGMLLAIMETAREAPDLEVRTVSEQRGLEYVRSIRLASPGIACATGGYALTVSDRPMQPTQPPGFKP
jgi:quinol monooxygenase YgiN